MDHSPPDSSVHGILQARILEWVAKPSFQGSSQPGNLTSVSYISCIGRRSLPLVPLMPPLVPFPKVKTRYNQWESRSYSDIRYSKSIAFYFTYFNFIGNCLGCTVIYSSKRENKKIVRR